MKQILGLIIVALALTLFSCNNDENMDNALSAEELREKSAQATINEVKSEAVSVESEYEVEYFTNMERTLTRWMKVGKRFKWNKKLRYETNHCPNVEIVSDGANGYPKTITLNYGDSTVLRNGSVLAGLIEIYISAPRNSQDFERTVTYTDFSVDSVTVNGTSSIVIDKVDTMLREHTSDLVFVLTDGTTIDRYSKRVWQWVGGLETEEDQSDDYVLITGSASVTVTTDTSAFSYTKEITEPLKKVDDCPYIVEGVITIDLNGEISTIDYGDGECDASATVTFSDGTSEEIDLARKEYKNKKDKDNKGKSKSNSKKNQSGK